MASGLMALGDAKSGRDVDPTFRPDSRLAFRRPGRQTHGAHRMQGIIFADGPCRLGSLPPIYPKMTMRAPYKSQGVVGGKTKNASCSELGDENASCTEPGGLQLPGVQSPYMSWSYGPRGRTRRLRLTCFLLPPGKTVRFAPFAMGCSNPTSNFCKAK